ncbi:hypothetical protein CEXT_381821 [Caerostris extrusa]|uniref:Uncharacterized protein n=1 Tax=Caerostris extrusa TaxID=172846 RepID=A0AAV4WF83_CAEEX|nr:hypothetical protein CEXT_381821 [Caerostris extrusa]
MNEASPQCKKYPREGPFGVGNKRMFIQTAKEIPSSPSLHPPPPPSYLLLTGSWNFIHGGLRKIGFRTHLPFSEFISFEKGVGEGNGTGKKSKCIRRGKHWDFRCLMLLNGDSLRQDSGEEGKDGAEKRNRNTQSSLGFDWAR